MIGINLYRLAPEETKAFIKERGLTYPTVLATPELLEAYGGIIGTPTAFLVDQTGTVVKTYVGDSSEIEEDLEWTIEVLLRLKSGPRPTSAKGPGGTFRPIRDFPLFTFEGETVPFSRYHGKIVLVDLWLLGSAIAKSGIPRLQFVAERFKAHGLVVLGIHLDSSNVGEVKAFLDKNHVTYPNFLASSEAIDVFEGLSVIPTLLLIDQQGVVRKRYETLSSAVYAEIDATIVELLKLAKPGEQWVLGHWGPNGEWVEGHFEKAEP